jgi:sugar lactone lactonase YvrE
MRQAAIVAAGLDSVEGPRWHNGRLWFASGMHVVVLREDNTVGPVVEVPGDPGGFGWLPDGRLLVVSWEHRKLFRLEPDRLVEHADLSGVASWYTNDMVVDARGRAWVGNWGFDLGAYLTRRDLLGVAAITDLPTATLARVDPDGTVTAAADGLRFPNGVAVTPDGATLIVAETFAERLTAFAIAPTGALEHRRTWAALPGVVPDGIALDAEGAAWVANPAAAECLRVAPGGRVLDHVATSQPCYACALGGRDRRTLYLLTNPPFGSDAFGPGAGRVEAVVVEAPGAGWP